MMAKFRKSIALLFIIMGVVLSFGMGSSIVEADDLAIWSFATAGIMIAHLTMDWFLERITKGSATYA